MTTDRQPIAPRIHFSGGLAVLEMQAVTYYAPGYPCCCSGDRAEAIAASGNQSDNMDKVTCERCLANIRRSTKPGKVGREMGIPARASDRFDIVPGVN